MQDYDISVVLTVHNKEDMIEKVFTSIVENISEKTGEIIVVFDGCSDRSEQIVDMIIRDKQIENKVQKIHTPDIFELRANNCGLKASSCRYSIIIQDDVVITEKDFDNSLVKPMLVYDDIFAVTARNSHNIAYENLNLIYTDLTGPEVGTEENMFSIRTVINRGPIAFDNFVLRQLNYFDEEFSPNAFDDMDLCLRAYGQYKKKCGSYMIGFDSKPEWGTGRQKNQSLHAWAHKKNSVILFLRHRELIEKMRHFKEDRVLFKREKYDE